MTMSDEPRPPHLGFAALFLKFLRFGLLAFGGPVAQIAMIRQQLVEEEGWIDGRRFARLLAVMQALPGPEAHELCVHFGMMARGRVGGLLAGLGFMLPGFVLMLACAWVYARFVADAAWLEGALVGLQAVVLAIIARAVHRIGGHVLADRLAIALAVIAAASTLAGAPFWIALLAAALASLPAWSPVMAALLAVAIALAGWMGFAMGGVVAPPPPHAVLGGTAALFIAGLKGGLLTFGGAYTAIPYVRADTVGRGWISDAAFLDGVALAGVLPAPLVIFGTFVGYIAGGLAGAFALTLGMFVPAFAFSLIFYERLERIVADPRLHRMLDGVAAAVVGIIAATTLQLGYALFLRVVAPLPVGLIFAMALVAAFRFGTRWMPPLLLAAGALAGWGLVPA